MAGLWQRTGNVTVTNGSKTVTGFGTKWKTGVLPIQKGHTFYGPDNAAYEVDTVVSDESILLVDAYRGGTLANQAYRIDITRTSTISQFAADLASLVGKYRTWFDGMMTWLTGSGDVSILNPDTGANTTIPSWKKVASEGEGQAARAKIEADKATAAAALSVNAVREAAVPFPDVWAPLNDSLRMFAGYGREVKVGDDVVGRYVNFSRATTATYIDKSGELKTAAINEPRFEKEGLLIEGPSTNIVASSAPTSVIAGTVSANLAAISATPDGYLFSVTNSTGSTWGQVISVAGTYAAGSSLTFSFTPEWSENADIYLRGFYQVDGSVTDVSIPGLSLQLSSADKGVRKTLTVVLPESAVILKFRLWSGAGLWPVGATFTLKRAQAELLPFATSFIPTSGAAATRAGDVAYIPWNGNVDPLLGVGNKTTAAVEYSLKGSGSAHAHRILLSHFGGLASEGNFILRLDSGAPHMSFYRGASTTSKADVSASDRSGVAAVRVKADNTTNLFVNGKAFGGGVAQAVKPGSPLTLGVGGANGGSFPLFGHIRNLKLWNRELADSQVLAIK